MTVRLPSRIKEGNKRYRGQVLSYAGGGAGVSLPYQRDCLPLPSASLPTSPAQPSQPATRPTSQPSAAH